MSIDHGKLGDGIDEGGGVHFVPGLIAVGIDPHSDGGQEGLARVARLVGGSPADEDTLRRLLDEDDALQISRIADLAGLIQIDADPRFAAAGISATGVPASPVHALGYQWHKSYSELPLGEPVKFDHDAMDAGNEGRVIAVVDSGISDDVPGWVGDNVDAEGVDLDTDFDEDGASHGTFVASVLRQLAPIHQVYMARAGRFRSQKLRGPGDEHDREAPPTTEAHVSAAILRLIERLAAKGGAPVDALNISLGGPSDEIPRRAMVLLSAAVDRWRLTFPTAPVFAAAGNSKDWRRVFPAAFPEVRGVSACNIDGRPVVWTDREGNDLNPSPRVIRRRRWVNDLAPGVDLVGLTGHGEEARKWSGSSFATAVASGGYAGGRPADVSNGVTRWSAD